MQSLLQTIQTTADSTPEHDRALHQYAELQEAFQEQGGYSRESDAKKVLLGLGFDHSDWDRPAAEFSGGWRMRILLAKLLLQKPDLLLLDEPTNHLDADALLWFEQYLTGAQTGMVAVSHDRYFLDRVVSEIAEIETRRFRLYKGNYSKYHVKKEELREQLLAQKRNQDREIAQIENFIDRNRARKDRAAQAQSRIKLLEKVERIEIEEIQDTVSIPLPTIPRSGKEVITLDQVEHLYDETRALHPVSLSLYRGERIGVWGANGAGKSTLLSLMAKKFEPTRGTVTWGYNTHLAYFSQHHAELQNSQQSIYDELAAVAPAEMQTRLRDTLACFLFRGDDIFKPVSVCSGGEKSRLALAKLLVRPINVMILDEPLNHLDLNTIEIFEETLKRYDGTLIFVSHDRFFIDRLAHQVWEIIDGCLRVFRGNFTDYEYAKRSLIEQEEKNNGQEIDARSARQQKMDLKRQEAEERNRLFSIRREQEKKCESIEEQIHEIEEEIESIEERMASGQLIQFPSEMAKTHKRYKTLLKQKEKLYAQWEKMVEAIQVE